MTSDAAWLSPGEADAWLDLVAVAELLPSALSTQLERDSQMNFFEYLTLAQLAAAPNRTLRVSQLATETNATTARLSRVVTRLEGEGLVAREPDTSDGRGRLVRLLDAGVERLADAAPGHVANVRRLFADVLAFEEAQVLAATCRRLLARLDPEREVLARTRTGAGGRPGLCGPPT